MLNKEQIESIKESIYEKLNFYDVEKELIYQIDN